MGRKVCTKKQDGISVQKMSSHRCPFHVARLANWQFSSQHFADPKDQLAPSDHRSRRGRTASCEATALQYNNTDSYRHFQLKDTAGRSEPGCRHYPGGSNSGRVGGLEGASQTTLSGTGDTGVSTPHWRSGVISASQFKQLSTVGFSGAGEGKSFMKGKNWSEGFLRAM